jgi:hypothetical protein
MQQDSWTNLLGRIKGLAGVDAFTSGEETKLLSLANRRIYQAYRASDMWARYIVGAQARPGPDNIIPWEYAEGDGDRGITTATRSGATVTVVCDADIDGDFVAGQFVTIAALSFSTADPNGEYRVASISDDDTFTFELSDTTLTGTETYTGSGTVEPVALPDVDTFIRVFNAYPYHLANCGEYNFHVESDGCHVAGNASGALGFWVCYKKQWGGDYTALSTDIPYEFFNYAAHGTYADFLRMDSQVGAALSEEAAAQQYLLIELDRPQNQANARLISSFANHGTAQNR